MAKNAGTQLIEKGKIDGKEVVRAGMETTFTKLVEQGLESLLNPAQNGTQSPPVPQPPLPDALTNELEEQSVVPLPNQDAEVPAQPAIRSKKQPSPSDEGLRDQEQKNLEMAKEKKLEVQGRWQARFDQLKVIDGEDYSNDLNNIMRKPPAERIKFEEVVDKYIAENYDNRNAVLSQPGRSSIKQPSPSEQQPELRIRGKQEISNYPPDNSALEKATDLLDVVTTYGQGKTVNKLDKINKFAKIIDYLTTKDRQKKSSIAGGLIEEGAAMVITGALAFVEIPVVAAGIATSLLIGSDSVGDATLKPDSKLLHSQSDKPLVYPTEQKRYAPEFFPQNLKKPTIIRESTEEEKMQVERHFHSKK